MGLRTEAKHAVVAGLRWLRDHLQGEEVEGTADAGDAPATSTAAAAVDARPAVHDALTSDGAVDAAPPVDAAPAEVAPAEVAPAPPAGPPPLTAEESDRIYDAIIDALHTVYDPEIPVDIYELGLIYRIEVKEDRHVHVTMTLTSPNCPSAAALPEEVDQKVQSVEGVVDSMVEVVFEPPWTPANMSEEARLELNM